MINYYKLIIKGRYAKSLFNKIIKNNINIYDILYIKDTIIFKVSYQDYLKIQDIKSSTPIEIIDIHGINKIRLLINKYKLFIINSFISLLIIIIFSNMIFFININSDNNTLVDIIKQELKNNKITLYSIKKDYNELKIISNNIKQKYSNYFEWLEISSNGVKYDINFIERKKNKIDENIEKNSIVASKNGLIMDIYAESGQIIKNKGDYVSRGEVIVSGIITKNEGIKNIVNAKAKVYAETWYKVKINHPFIYQEQELINKGIYRLSFTIFNKEITIYKRNINNLKNKKEFYLLKNDLFSIKISKKNKVDYVTKKYNKDELIKKIEKMAKEKVLESLEEDEKILLQKTLKITTDNDTLYMEVFFKVYENIALSSAIKIVENNQ